MYREAFSLWTLLACAALGTACQDEVVDHAVDAAVDASEPELAFGASRAVITPLTLGSSVGAQLSLSSPSYPFSFTLTQPASVSLRTAPGDGGAVVDTVLVLYRVDNHGLPRAIAISDDFEHTKFSGLDRKLGKGEYRLTVRGATVRTTGPFVLNSTCTGTGCPQLPSACLFGEQFSDLRDNAALTIVSEVWVRKPSELSTPLMRDQAVLAVRQSSHDDVVTPEEALEAVDQNEIRHMELRETRGTRTYSVYEYGVGDNSYGAIFEGGSLTLAASIHDGELIDCIVTR